jgi:hypothetical protein
MIVRKFLLLKSVQCFVKKDKTSLKFLGSFVLFVTKIWAGLSVPKGYFVLGTFCPKERSVAGTFQPGTLRPRTFRQGIPQNSKTNLLNTFFEILSCLLQNCPVDSALCYIALSRDSARYAAHRGVTYICEFLCEFATIYKNYLTRDPSGID